MNKLYDWGKDALNKYIQSMEKQSLLPPIAIPELYNIKKVHQLLLMEYIHVINGATNLPFFMNPIQKVHATNKWVLFRRVLSLIFVYNNPIRLITLRPLVIFLIEIHISKKLNELEIAYTQLKYLIPYEYYDRENFLQWLEQAKQDCAQLKETVSSIRRITDLAKALSVPLVGLLLAFLGANSIYDLIFRLVSNKLGFQSLVLIVGLAIILVLLYLYGSIFIENTFTAKRSIFLNVGNDKNSYSIYSLENKLFDLINRRKSKEFAIDYFVSAINHLFPIGVFAWLAYQLDKAYSKSTNPSTIYINCLWAPVILFGLEFVVGAIIPWINRFKTREI